MAAYLRFAREWLLRPDDGVAQARGEPGQRVVDAGGVAAVEGDLDAVVVRLEVRIRADLDVGEGGDRLVERARDRALAGARVQRPAVDRRRPGTARARPRTCAGRSTARRAGPRRCARRPPARAGAGRRGRTPAARPRGCRPCADRVRAARRRRPARSSASSSGRRTSSIPKAAATARSVTSSCVGPTPPDVNTKSKRGASARTLAAISSVTSGRPRSAAATPPARAARAIRKRAFSSSTLPGQDLVADEQDGGGRVGGASSWRHHPRRCPRHGIMART